MGHSVEKFPSKRFFKFGKNFEVDLVLKKKITSFLVKK